MISRKVYNYGLVFAFIFLLNFIWEMSQAFLYKAHFQGMKDFIIVHLKATIGDIFLFIIIYSLGVLVFQSRYWIFNENKSKIPFIILTGFTVAVIVEKLALLAGYWSYNNLMPIIPFFRVGITAVLQMIILPIVAINFCKRILKQSILL